MRMLSEPAQISGTVDAPPSKSVTIRAVAAAVLSPRPAVLLRPSDCEDAAAAWEIARALGARVAAAPGRVTIESGATTPDNELRCGESGLCARLFLPLAALSDRPVRIVGRGSLLKRPLGPVERPLADLGAECVTDRGFLPATVRGPLRGGRTSIDASSTSQFLTGLLTALPRAAGDSELEVRGLVSVPYVRLTLALLSAFGIIVEHDDFRVFRVRGGQTFRRDAPYPVEGDWSGAAFLLVAGAVAGSVSVRGLDAESPQADRAILDALRLAGTRVSVKGAAVSASRGTPVPFEFDVTDCPDLAPPLAVLAAHAPGESVLRGTDRLRAKESDRAAALARVLGTLGIEVRVEPARMIIRGGTVRGGRVDAGGDHRIAMAAATAALAASGPVEIDGAECVAKSYPGFFADLAAIGGRIHG